MSSTAPRFITRPEVSYEVNGNTYHVPYWLADGIYPANHCFVKSISNPSSKKHKHFTNEQEKKRKDVERAFGILQARFHVLTVPCRLWSRDAMCSVIKCCVILHNLIIDFEKKTKQDSRYTEEKTYKLNEPFTITRRHPGLPLSTVEKVINMAKIQDTEMHHQLRNDLISHLWDFHGACQE